MTSSHAKMSKMQDFSAWQNRGRLTEFLAQQLNAGRLCLVIGAGLLAGFGLPNWDQLTDKAFAKKGAIRPSGLTNEAAADELLRKHCQSDDNQFAQLIRDALYDGVDLSMDALRRRDILAAVGALMMSSSRGSVRHVVTFNFDDLLERYLEYYGFFIESVIQAPSWDSRADARVYHPHGFLPSRPELEGTKIVMAEIHFDRVIGNTADAWHTTMLDVVRANTCLFIGLSGEDANLRNVLAKAQGSHASVSRQDAFWGVRFAKKDDAFKNRWEGRGVFQFDLASYDDLPSVLFSICQTASEMWKSRFR